MDRIIDSISFSISTWCNMKCPNCCAATQGINKLKSGFVEWDYVVNAAKYFYGIRKILLTGGECTIHPKFEEWAPKLKELFGCQVLSIWTNGTMFRKKKDAFKHFDEIHITNYTAKTFEGSPDNTEDIAFIRDYLKDYPVKIYSTGPVEHLTPETKKGNNMCFRGRSETVEFVDGNVYPCCAASGLPTKVNVPIGEGWMEKVKQLHPPCSECVFGEK